MIFDPKHTLAPGYYDVIDTKYIVKFRKTFKLKISSRKMLNITRHK